jgi:hypothetical protein
MENQDSEKLKNQEDVRPSQALENVVILRIRQRQREQALKNQYRARKVWSSEKKTERRAADCFIQDRFLPIGTDFVFTRI